MFLRCLASTGNAALFLFSCQLSSHSDVLKVDPTSNINATVGMVDIFCVVLTLLIVQEESFMFHGFINNKTTIRNMRNNSELHSRENG